MRVLNLESVYESWNSLFHHYILWH
uniref:Uncharacterized protein n=1 Tax=Anguilla anguilla TaxID=7936 RepID=A0A0E9RUM1_ANGAN